MKIQKLLIVAVLVLFFSSCKKYLDKMPDNQLTLEMVFKDKIRTEEWLAGIYSGVPDPYIGYLSLLGWDYLSDDLAVPVGLGQFGNTSVAKQLGDWNPASPFNANYWTELPKRIRSAYIFIENVKPNDAQLFSQKEVDLMKAEARFLIAYYYSLMLEAYGPVPFTTGLTPADASEDELMIGRAPYDYVVDWVDNELLKVSEILPASYVEAGKYGRATSIMCMAVRARMLLFAASPLVNGNLDYKGFTNKKNEVMFNSDYDSAKWAKAAKASKDLIDLAEKNGHKLYYEYNTDGSIDPFLSYQNMMFRKANEGNNEILFARPNSDGPYIDTRATPRGAGGNGWLGVTQSLVDAFFMKNGRPINDPLSGYVEKGFSTAVEKRNTKWAEVQVAGQVTLPETFNMYVGREPRFYISVLYNDAWHRIANRKTRFYFNGVDGGPIHDSPQNGYLLRKKLHPDANIRNKVTPYRPGILYRLGEAYLNYAEALNEAEPGHPNILKYLNLIRERSGVPMYGTGLDALPVPVGQDAVRTAIRRERRVELNSEGIRFADIRRWKIGEELLNGDFYGMNFQGTEKDDNEANPKAYFKRTVTLKRVFTKKMYWVPIPQSEMDKNHNLVQNPFWQE